MLVFSVLGMVAPMTIAKLSFDVDGKSPVSWSIGYEIIGDEGARNWVITLGRYGKSYRASRDGDWSLISGTGGDLRR